MKSVTSLMFTVLLAFAICNAKGNATPVEAGKLSGTLRAPAEPDDYYAMQGCYEIPAGDTLIIEGGVKIVFTDWNRWIVRGVVLANGTLSKDISFKTAAANGDSSLREIRFEKSTGTSIFSSCQWTGGTGGFSVGLYEQSSTEPCVSPDFSGTTAHCIGSTVEFSYCTFLRTQVAIVADSNSHIKLDYCNFVDGELDLYGQHSAQVFVGHKSTLNTYKAHWINSAGNIVIRGADSIAFRECSFVDNYRFGIEAEGDSYVSISSSVFEENECGSAGLFYSGRDARIALDYCKLFRNFAIASTACLTVRPGGAMSISNCTATANFVGSDPGGIYGGPIRPLIANYGTLNAYRTIFSDAKPNFLFLTGQPAISPPGGAIVCGTTCDYVILEEGEKLLPTDTARATFAQCCVHNFLDPAMRVEDAYGTQRDFVRLPIVETAITRPINSDPQFENSLFGDLRLCQESPCIGPYDPAAITGRRPSRWIVGCGDEIGRARSIGPKHIPYTYD
jgi:hypothetical protein